MPFHTSRLRELESFAQISVVSSACVWRDNHACLLHQAVSLVGTIFPNGGTLQVMQLSDSGGAETDGEMYAVAKEEYEECVQDLTKRRQELEDLLVPRCGLSRL